MIILGIVACVAGFQVSDDGALSQCYKTYDTVNSYADEQSCEMRVKEIGDKLALAEDDHIQIKVVCVDWRGKKTKFLPFLGMMEGWHAKVDL